MWRHAANADDGRVTATERRAAPRQRVLRVLRVLVALALLVVAALIALWLSRVPIARGLIGRELTRRGVADHHVG